MSYAENCGTPFHSSELIQYRWVKWSSTILYYWILFADTSKFQQLKNHHTNFLVVQRNTPFEVNSLLQLLTMHAGELEQGSVTWFAEEEEKKENEGIAQSFFNWNTGESGLAAAMSLVALCLLHKLSVAVWGVADKCVVNTPWFSAFLIFSTHPAGTYILTGQSTHLFINSTPTPPSWPYAMRANVT